MPDRTPAERSRRHGHAGLRDRIFAQVTRSLGDCQSYAARFATALPVPEVRFDLRGRTAGQCRWHPRQRPVLRFNMPLAERHTDAFIAHTVPHEVAHLVALACHGPTPPHGAEWRAVMRHLGIHDPQRCHDYPVAPGESRRQRRWPYRCDCSEHTLSTTRHHRVLRRHAEYRCRRCGGLLRPSTADR